MAEALVLRLCARMLPLLVLLTLAASLAGRGLPREGFIAYVSQYESSNRIHLMDITRSLNAQMLPHNVAPCCLSWSPDGEWLAFRRPADSHIYLADAAGGKLRQLEDTIQDGRLGSSADWSPDGARVAFMAAYRPDERPAATAIYVADASSGLTERLTEVEVDALYPRWSPDGLQLVFICRFSLTTAGEICRLNVATRQVHQLTDNLNADGSPVWSPDGRLLAFVSDRERNYEIYIMDAESGETRRLTYDREVDIAPAWSPDGTQIAFTSARDGNFELYLINSDGTGTRRLTHTPQMERPPSWSADGRHLLYLSGSDTQTEVYVFDLHEDEPRRLTFNRRVEVSPVWR